MTDSRHAAMRTNPSQQPVISRRGFLYGALGAAAAVAVGGIVGATQCSKTASDNVTATDNLAELTPLAVANDAVFTTENCEYLENASDAIKMVAQARLPYGTVVWAGDDSVAACLLPCETSTPLMQVGILSFDTSMLTTVLKSAVDAANGYEIYDARANSHGMVWLEADILNQHWRVYTAELFGAMTSAPYLGPAGLVAEGDEVWDMPELAASKGFAFWQLCPAADGPRSKESSVLMRAPFGSAEDAAKVVYESEGRFACSPSSTSTGIAIAPRAQTKGVSYQLVHLNADGGEKTDSLLLPTSMRPTFVSYGSSGFSFAFDSIYSYGDGISQLGTYTPASGQTEGEWFRFARTPYTEPAWCGDWFIVKSTSVIAGIDMANRRYFTMSSETATQGYGEFLASSGAGNRFVTYSNIDYTPLSGSRITECNVRIWQAV